MPASLPQFTFLPTAPQHHKSVKISLSDKSPSELNHRLEAEQLTHTPIATMAAVQQLAERVKDAVLGEKVYIDTDAVRATKTFLLSERNH